MTITALVKTAWIVENLQLVGGGGLFALAYNLSQLSQPAQIQLLAGNILPGMQVAIYQMIGDYRAKLVADGHLEELVRVDHTLRLDIRLLHVRPFVAKQEIAWLCPAICLDVA